jgi:spermidine synthase
MASLIFPLLFVPHVGLIRTSLFFGIVNTGVALWVIYSFKDQLTWIKSILTLSWSILLLLVIAFIYADTIQEYSESFAFQDKVIISKSSPYQRIVVTNSKKELRLYLNGNLQFSTLDEYRYHETLVHPIMSSIQNKDTIVIMGGGDGLAIRELLKYPTVKKIYLIDLDREVTQLFKTHPALNTLNELALLDPRVEVKNEDAYIWAIQQDKKFNTIIIDFPDPSNYSLGKLYSTSFYKHLFNILNPNGCIVIQSTSPYYAPNSFWCVNNTLKHIGFNTLPYHTYIPSFGEWGYILAYKNTFDQSYSYPTNLKFINKKLFEQMTLFPQDMAYRETDVNKLNNQALVHYFDQEWSKFIQ